MRVMDRTWVLPHTGGYLLMPAALWSKISVFTRGVEAETEAGGLLIGCYRGPHVEITEITTPFRGDKRSKYSFYRRDPEHNEILRGAWQKSGSTATMLGEWHTHQTGFPTPSPIDTSGWSNLTNVFKQSMCFIILGSRGHWAGIKLGTEPQAPPLEAMPLFE